MTVVTRKTVITGAWRRHHRQRGAAPPSRRNEPVVA
jgi:hypothetical protein